MITRRATRRMTKKGREATPRRMIDCSNRRLAIKRFMPMGGGGIADLQVGQKHNSQVEEVYIISLGNWDYERRYDHKGRINI